MPPRKKSDSLGAREVRAIAKVLADPHRYQILKLIAAEPCKACSDLRAAFDITAPTLSHHLKELEAAGLIEVEKRGKFVDLKFRRETWNAYLSELSGI
jgi:ArsR family transcriptional regulator